MKLKFMGNMLDDGKILEAQSIELLIKAGLSAALFDISISESEIKNGSAEVLTAFVNLNTPVALVLRSPANRLKEAALLAANYKFNYIWITDKANKEDISNLSDGYKIISSVKDTNEIESLMPFCAGFFLDETMIKTETAEKLRQAGKQIFAAEPHNPLIDCVVYENPELIKGQKDNAKRPADYLLSRSSHLNNTEDVIAYSAVLAAEKLSAKAIIVMCCEASPVDRVTSYYPPMPVIAVANRKLYEALLLSFCCNYGVLPTAITKIPPKSGEEIDFARFVADLYGYQAGDTIIVTGSYSLEGNKDYVEVVSL